MPFISVIIPTRERCDTLASALKTVCGQDFTDAEFLISDNVSEDGTADVVAGFTDPRIKYIRTPKRLSMTGNYNFALGHARGMYVTILGDDDGFVPGALSVLARWAQTTGADAISWAEASYYWPNHSLPERRNQLHIPLFDLNLIVSAKAAFTAARWAFLRWNYLPIIYGGLVKMDVMNKLHDKTGQYLSSHIPDVYSAIALSSIIDQYIYTEYPFSVLGFSGKSMASIYHSSWSAGATTSTDTFSVFLQENTTQPHPAFPVGDLRLESAAMADCLYRVRDAIFGGRLLIPDSVWLYRLFKEARTVSEPLKSEMLSRLELITRQRRRRWVVRSLLALSEIKNTSKKLGSPWRERPLIEEGRANVDSARFDVTNVFSACDLVVKLRPPPSRVPNFTKAGIAELFELKRLKRRWTS